MAMTEDDFFSPERALRKCEEFKHLSDEEINTLISIGHVETINRGKEVFSINHKGKNFYVVIYGRLSLRLGVKASKEYKMGQLFGEVAMLGDTLRFGTIRATEESKLISFNREDIFYSDRISKELALKITLALTRKVISYLNVEKWESSKDLIKKGECDFVEFKRSIHENNKDDIVRNIASFLNLNGGTIFCGVEDKNGEIVGLDADPKEFDTIQIMIGNEIDKRLGHGFRRYVNYDIEDIDGKTVIRIDCSSSNSPVFFKKLKKGKEFDLFIVRSGSQNKEMQKTKNIINYVQERFKHKE